MKPLIGITMESAQDPGNERSGGKMILNWNYAQVIADAGGVPILLPPSTDAAVVAELIDGWLIPGGLDIDAANFDEENHPEVELQDPARYAIEKAILDVLPEGVPIFGICYGCQFLNVALGGSLIQHLPDVVGHEQHSEGVWEEIAVTQGSLLSGYAGGRLKGKSYHHQAIGRVAEPLTVTARALDGTIEAVESKSSRWMVAVQWHPERSYAEPGNARLIEAFVTEARRYRASRGAAR